MLKNSLLSLLLTSTFLSAAPSLMEHNESITAEEEDMGHSFLGFINGLVPVPYFKMVRWINEFEVKHHWKAPYHKISGISERYFHYKQGESLTSDIQFGNKTFVFDPYDLNFEGEDLHLYLGILPSEKIVSFMKTDIQYRKEDLSKILNGEGSLRVVSVVEEHELEFVAPELNTKQVDTPDNQPLPLAKIIEGVAFIDEGLMEGDSIYVHCKSGVGRSATVVAAWYIKHFHMSAAEAAAFVKERRTEVVIGQIGHYHQKALERFERALKTLKK